MLAMQSARSVRPTEVMPSRASPLPPKRLALPALRPPVKPEERIKLVLRGVCFCDCCVAVAHQTERSHRSSAAATEIAQYTRTEQAGRSAASGRSVFDLPALPGGREEVLWSGSTGMDAGRAAMGHGWPVAACPRSRACAREPEQSEGRTMGRKRFGYFAAFAK